MPTYIYACSTCPETTEAVQRIFEEALTVCPHCGGTLKRVIQPAAVVYNGKGFHSTDYPSR